MKHTFDHEVETLSINQDEQLRAEIARRSAVIYLSISIGVALLFFLTAYTIGGYPTVAKLGGMFWVGLLSLIISMPIVTARVKKRLQK